MHVFLGRPRSSIFVTTKLPAGLGNATDCTADPQIAIDYVKYNDFGINFGPPCFARSHPHRPRSAAPRGPCWQIWRQVCMVGQLY